jgi:hypothetical protein
MKLTELEPRWIHENLFIFKCPHCMKDFLSCKNTVMTCSEQYDIFEAALGSKWNMAVVPCEKDRAWNISSRDFATMTVTPSLDASSSGHAHISITNGEIV